MERWNDATKTNIQGTLRLLDALNHKNYNNKTDSTTLFVSRLFHFFCHNSREVNCIKITKTVLKVLHQCRERRLAHTASLKTCSVKLEHLACLTEAVIKLCWCKTYFLDNSTITCRIMRTFSLLEAKKLVRKCLKKSSEVGCLKILILK